MNTFIRKFIGFSIGPVVGALLSFVTIPLTTYFIRPDEYGKASMFLLVQMIFATFLFLGIDQAYTRVYHEQQDKRCLFQNALLIPLILACLTLILTLTMPGRVSQILFGTSHHGGSAVLFGVMIIFMVLERFILLSIRMREQALAYSLLNIFVKFAVLTLTLIFVLFIRRDFLAVVYSAVFGQILGDLYLLFRYRNLFQLNHFTVDRRLLKGMLTFGLPVVVATSLSSLLNSMDQFSLRAWSSFYQIGIFAATLKIAAALSIIQTSFTSFWIPTAYRWYSEGKPIRYYQMVSDAILLGMSTIAVFILIFKDLIVALLSSGYADARYIIGFLCLPPIIFTVSETTCLGIVFSKKSYLGIWVGLIALIPNIIINLLLVPLFGAVGAATATAVSYIFFFAARTYFSAKNGLAFPVLRHYSVFLLLFGGAFLNLLPWQTVTLLNIGLLLVVLLIQYPAIHQIWLRFRRREVAGIGKN
ncbi:lipopolysaccharide biosynthesis protein [Sporolactobacillus vineae]|uniref:lipopolysaccharide biosynthesis protein n=1 Tax=Sporolactobacillus vineae TaxID=444463 RepID=UPI001EE68355|nr:oligosaccharide flippase family protein [Sporolactobacillus vineae]